MIEVQFDRGVYLPQQKLWADPWDRRAFAFVSHAHADHTGQHTETIMSVPTARLMRARIGGKGIDHALEFGVPTRIRDLELMLYPAGHVLGSAQLHLQSDRGSLLYTGDFKLRSGLSAEPIAWAHAETLVMETTYGLSHFIFPPTPEVLADVVKFCHETLEDGGVPVLLGYSLGKSQEILSALHGAGLPIMLHKSVVKITRLYEELGVLFPPYHEFAQEDVAGHVVICPPNVARSKSLVAIQNRRTAALTGWAVGGGATYRHQCDAAFPLSDHADYPELIEYVQRVAPKRVLTLHGYASEFARDLRERGIEAWALTGDNQLEFSIFFPSASESAEHLTEVAEAEPAIASPFATFGKLGEKIAKTTGKKKKRDLLADYFRGLEEEDLRRAALYFTGRVFPQCDPRVVNTGWAIVRRALLKASGVGEMRVRQLSRRYRDAGTTVEQALRGQTRPEPVTLEAVERLFAEMERQRGPLRKTELLHDFFRRATPLEGKYLVKILTGDLRIGLKEGLVEEAIAESAARELEAVREASMLTGDVGLTAVLARRGTLHEAVMKPLQPVKVMLAAPEPTAEAVWQRFHPEEPSKDPQVGLTVWIEDKFDGIRAQLHKVGSRVEIFSRDLRPVTNQFGELAQNALGFDHDLVIDGEIVAFEEGRKLTFFDLQKRLGRKGGDFFLGNEIPVVLVVFDLLWIDGRNLLKEPLQERRRCLDGLRFPPSIRPAGLTEARSPAEIEEAFHLARSRGNEGLLIKDPQSRYTPGRRGLSWIKLKKELATLDVVVVAVEAGHGKRRGMLSDYTFAVRDEGSGELVEIGKAYSGLTDAQILELTEHFDRHTIERRGSWQRVEPNVVLEVAFDSIQVSKRHRSGLAMRFPRIKAIRREKTVAEIDTLNFARTLTAQ